jgi:hypothetical protein
MKYWAPQTLVRSAHRDGDILDGLRNSGSLAVVVDCAAALIGCRQHYARRDRAEYRHDRSDVT